MYVCDHPIGTPYAYTRPRNIRNAESPTQYTGQSSGNALLYDVREVWLNVVFV